MLYKKISLFLRDAVVNSESVMLSICNSQMAQQI